MSLARICRVQATCACVAAAALGMGYLAGGTTQQRVAMRGSVTQSHLASLHRASLLEPKQYWGVSERDEATLANFIEATGLRPQIMLEYVDWLWPFYTDLNIQLHNMGIVPLIQMQPIGASLADIAAGKYDVYLKSYADSVGLYGYPVIMGFGHEMNGFWYQWGIGHTPPSTFVAAWQHIVNVFRNQGVRNVTWIWTVNGPGRVGPIKEWWPGDSYVDWVGIDGYYYSATDTFAGQYGSAIAAVRRITDKPICLCEVGIGQIAGQAQKMLNLFEGVKNNHLLGPVWMDIDTDGGIYHQHWRLEGRPEAISAFQAGVRLLLGN